MASNFLKKVSHILLILAMGFGILNLFFLNNTTQQSKTEEIPIISISNSESLPKLHIENQYLKVIFQNNDKILVSFQLKGFNNLDLLPIIYADNQTNANTSSYQSIQEPLNSISFKKEITPNIAIQRSYRFSSPYSLIEDVSIFNNSHNPETITSELIFKPFNIASDEESSSVSLYINKQKNNITSLELLKQSHSFSGALSLLKFDFRYFMFGISPLLSSTEKHLHQLNPIKILLNQSETILASSYKQAYIIPANSHITSSSIVYIGPKEPYLLNNTFHNPSFPLEDISSNKFDFINKPLSSLFILIIQWSQNPGIAIIILTALIKYITAPLLASSIKSQQDIAEVSSIIKKIQQEHKNDKTLQQEEQLRLYKEKKINPLSGCLPIIIQMPVWISLYYILNNSIEIYQQPLGLWISDLTLPDPYFILPILICISSMYTQLFSSPSTLNNSLLTWLFPIFISFLMSSLPSGLNLHILINNLLSILQQMISKKKL